MNLGGQRLQGAEIVPLHSSLGNRKKKKIITQTNTNSMGGHREKTVIYKARREAS